LGSLKASNTWLKKWSSAYKRDYYVNVANRTSTWEVPPKLDTVMGGLEDVGGEFIKKWSEKKQHAYFVSASSGASVWVLPEGATLLTPPEE